MCLGFVCWGYVLCCRGSWVPGGWGEPGHFQWTPPYCLIPKKTLSLEDSASSLVFKLLWNSQACKLLEKHSGGLLGWWCGPMTMRRALSVLTLSRSGGEGTKWCSPQARASCTLTNACRRDVLKYPQTLEWGLNAIKGGCIVLNGTVGRHWE